MIINERTKEEVKKRAEGFSDFVRMEYLESCIKNMRSIEISKYCSLELSKLYEKHLMYSDAVKFIEIYETFCSSDKEKIKAGLKQIEILIKGGFYDRLEYPFKKLKSISNNNEMYLAIRIIKNLFISEAEHYEQLGRYNQSLKAYNKLLIFSDSDETMGIKKRMLLLYKKLGKVKEHIELEKELKNSRLIQASLNFSAS